ncbi:MAG: hypothetical protein MJA28_11655 [Gammaproteobacteria bacterium]|nr:hypothetical protein [Gammaproteobacteria bacterium]
MSRPFVLLLIALLFLMAFQAKQAQMVSDIFIIPHTITPSALHGSAADHHQNTHQSHADCCGELAHCTAGGCSISALLTTHAPIQPIPLQRQADTFLLAFARAGYSTPPLRPPNT